MKKNIIIVILIITSLYSVRAENKSSYSMFGGYGYYEATFIGFRTYDKNKKRIWNSGIGYNFHLDNMSYTSLFGEYQRVFFRFHDRKIQTGITLKSIYWRQSDKFLIWGNLGLNPNLFSELSIKPQLSISLSFGPQYNFNLYNVRKNYEATGWIKRIDKNFQIAIAYELPFKK